MRLRSKNRHAMSEPSTCAECGARFFQVGAGWGDRLCGDCIAARIATALAPAGLRLPRRPMRRAETGTGPGWVEVAGDPHRKTG